MENGPATQESAAPSTSATALPGGTTAASHRLKRTALPVLGRWPLAAILAAQTVLSVRLVRADTAFQDEALYLHAGHLEWAHWLHGVPLPPFPSYFSGAPVLYPPLGALADSLGGLVGARILSLAFMLGTTVALWAIANRIFGRRAAFFAAAFFAVLGPTLHVGSFATYDAMSLFLLSLASWLVVRAGDKQDATGWMVAAGAVLALANATAYASTLFDPIVILMALIVAFPKPGGRVAAGRVLTLLGIVAVFVIFGLLLGGTSYRHGIALTTVRRVAGSDSPLLVLAHSWAWTGVVVAVAVCGVIIGWVTQPGSSQTWLLTLLACAALLVPLEQASLYTTASLNKHGALGAWFAAIAAGYAIDWLIEAAPAGNMRAVTGGACVLALSFPVVLGASQSKVFATSWPNASAFITVFRPLADDSTGRLLVEDPSIAEYYLPAGSQWERWSSTRNIVSRFGTPTGGPSIKAGIVGAGNAGTFALYIKQSYFSIIALNFADTTSLDSSIAADIKRNPHYHAVQVVPYGVGPSGPEPGEYVIWQYEPQS
jgi:dolichyl-phosphate-mannose-protein mannosyltransferase